MAISKLLIREAAVGLSQIEGLHMDANALLEDIVLLAQAFPKENEFMAACANTKKAMILLIRDSVTPAKLRHEFSDWSSYHYQHMIRQGAKATCRIMFRRVDGGIEVKGFGHRKTPSDFYRRMSASKRVSEAQ